MRAEPLGESAFLLRDFDYPAYVVAKQVRRARMPGVLDIVPSYESVGLVVDPKEFDLDALLNADLAAPESVQGILHRIPVDYSAGMDLDEVCDTLKLTPSAFIDLHSSTRYRCFAIGFVPGFPYLGYLPDPISGIPRRAAPRTLVPAGSVGIAANQTGIYPLDCPGGWALIGKTDVRIADPASNDYLFEAGDEVQFEPV